MLNVFIVGLGGFIGSALRYLVGGWTQGLSKSLDFPYGTLTVNLIGCFVIGFLGELDAYLETIDESIQAGMVTLEKATIRFYRGNEKKR